MSDTLLALVPQYGVYVLFGATFLSCLFLPVPSSILMLTGGAFAATGDLSLYSITLSAYVGAVIGDQSGFNLGRFGGARIHAFAIKNQKRAALLDRADSYIDQYGGKGVFFSTWLVAPLGPYVNFIAGVVRMNWLKFTIWDMAGEAVWVLVYVGLGYTFGDNIQAIGEILGNLSGALAAGAIAGVLGWGLFKRKKSPESPDQS
ncbi:MAG: DedA family protein [Rhodobacteraceae bacterium]|nr:DedA family protein [Paracoccaceae bacterium]